MLRIGLLLKEASSPGSEEGAASMSGPSGIESLSPIMTCASGKTDDSDLLCVEIERTKATSSGAERRFICSNVPVSQQEINPPTMVCKGKFEWSVRIRISRWDASHLVCA